MAPELARALQQAGRIRQRCAAKEPHAYVRSEYIDVAEGHISQTCNRTAVMQKLPDFVPAFSHHLKPLKRDSSQFTWPQAIPIIVMAVRRRLYTIASHACPRMSLSMTVTSPRCELLKTDP